MKKRKPTKRRNGKRHEREKCSEKKTEITKINIVEISSGNFNKSYLIKKNHD